MDVDLLVRLTVVGLPQGALLGLVAVGFSLIYGTSGHFHIAHIATITLSGYTAYFLASLVSLPFGLLVVFTSTIAGAIGLIVYAAVYHQLEVRRGAAGIMVFIASLGLLIFAENALLWAFGASPRRAASTVSGSLDIGMIRIGYGRLILVIVAVILTVGLTQVLKRTTAGILMRAVASNPRLLMAVGRRPPRVIALAYFVGSAVTGVAGSFLAIDAGIRPLSGHEFFIPAAMAVILAGHGSIAGAFTIAMAVGVAQSVGAMWISSGWAIAIVFAIFLLGIVLRPQGIFARPTNLKPTSEAARS